MALAQCTVSGVIQLPDTTVPVHGAKLVFILSNVEEETEIIAPIRVEAPINTTTGAFSVDLWPNALGTTESAYYVTLERFGATAARPVAPISLGEIYVPDSESASFSALIQTPPFTPPSASILGLATEAKNAAEVSADEAAASAAAAAASADEATVAVGLDALDVRVTAAESDIVALEGLVSAGAVRKESVLLATTANITLSGEQTIDGTLTSASRVLVKDQSTAAQNGIYVTGAGSWTRATDMDAAGEVQGALVYVIGGTANGGRSYYTGSAVTTLGTDAIVWQLDQSQGGLQDQIDVFADDLIDLAGRDGAFRALVSDDFEVLTRLDHLTGSSTLVSTLRGWRAPFKHNGEPFDAVQLSIRSELDNTRVLVKILDDGRTEIARGYTVANASVGVITVILDKVVTSLEADDIGYISYEPATLGDKLGVPGGAYSNVYPVGDADATVYREYYQDASGVWQLASPAGNYCIPFRALRLDPVVGSAAATAQIALQALSVATGSPVVVYDAGNVGHDTTYSVDGVGTQIAAQAAPLTFNQVTVYGGAAGAGIMRGYLVDVATAATHVPSASATLLFTASIDWTLTVQARTVLLDALYTVPAGKELHILWASNAATDAAVARWSTNSGGNLPRIRFSLTGVGDETGIWDETWYDSASSFWAVPPKLELAAATSGSGGSSSVDPYFTIPEVVNAVVGTEICLQYDSVCSAHSVGLTGLVGYSCAIVGPKGKNEERFWRFTPVSGDVGDHDFTAKLWDAAGNAVTSRSFTVTVHAATAPATAKNVLMIGDSLTAPGTITTTAQANFAALGATVPTFVGSQGTTPAFHEGYGGRTFAYFASEATDVYRVTVSGVSAVSADAVYTTGSVNYTVVEVNLVSGSGNLLLSGASSPASSGTLTYVSGSGDATITYSAVTTENTNPFWNSSTSQLDIANYRTNESIAAVINVVTLQLGVNDVFGEESKSDAELSTIIGDAQDLVDAFIADNASCQIVIVLPTLCGNTSDGYASNYGATYSREVYEETMFRFRRALLAAFDDGAYHANVTVGTGGLAIDRYFGYGRSSSAVSTRITDTAEKHYNAVHPIAVGYQQIGDAVFADIMAVI